MTYVLNLNDPWNTNEEPHTFPLQKCWIYSTRNQITTNILNPTIQWFSGQSSDADAKVTQKSLCGSYVEVISSTQTRLCGSYVEVISSTQTRLCGSYVEVISSTQTRLCGSYVEVIASKYLRSSSRTGWLLRDINGSFLLYVFFFFPLLPPRLLPVCWWVCLTRNLSFPCCVFFFVLCAFAMCPVPNIASVPGLSILQCHFGFR